MSPGVDGQPGEHGSPDASGFDFTISSVAFAVGQSGNYSALVSGVPEGMQLKKVTLAGYSNTSPQNTQVILTSPYPGLPGEALGLLVANGGTSSVSGYDLIFEDGPAPAGSSLTDGATYGPALNAISVVTVNNGTWFITATIQNGATVTGSTGDIILHFE